MALPNPNKELVGQSQTQTLTLKDLLFYQQETEKWSQNTDVNTFRAYIEEKQQGEELVDTLKNMQTGESNSLRALTESQKDVFEDLKNKFKSDSQILYESFERFVNVLATPFEKFVRDQNEKYFAGMGKDFFSATAQLEGGAARVNSGLKELTNGIGALGPAINTLRTGMYKTIAVFNVFFGTIQTLLGFFGKLGKVVFRLFGFGKEAAEREKLEQEHLEAQKALAEKETEIKKQEALEGQKSKLIDPLPLPVTMGTDATASIVPKQEQKKDFRGIELPDGSMSLEQEDDRSEKLMKMDEERAELQKKYDELDAKRNKKLDEEQSKSSNKFGRLGALLLVTLIAMAISMGAGFFSGPARIISESAKRLSRLVGETAKSAYQGTKNLFNKFSSGVTRLFGGDTPKTGGGGSGAGRGANVILGPDGRPIDGPGGPRPNLVDPAGNPIDTPNTTPNISRGARAAQLARIAAGEAIPFAGSVYEGVMDAKTNKEKFEAIERGYNAGANFNFKDGPRPMTPEEFEEAKIAYQASIAGSVGRTGGGFAGGLAGFKAGLKIVNPFDLKGMFSSPKVFLKKILTKNFLVGGGIVVGTTLAGAAGGATYADDALTSMFEGDVKDSQDVLNNFATIAPKVAEDIENITNDTKDATTSGSGSAVDSTSVNTAIDNSSSTTIESGRTSFFDWFNSNSYSNPTLGTYNMK